MVTDETQNRRTPADLAQVVDPLKEWITYKWAGVVIGIVLLFFCCFVSFVLAFVTGHMVTAAGTVFLFVIVFVLFLLYARTPTVLEDNWRGLLFYGMNKAGLNSFSKYSSRIKRWWIRNFTGYIEMDEETGLCREMTNQDMI